MHPSRQLKNSFISLTHTRLCTAQPAYLHTWSLFSLLVALVRHFSLPSLVHPHLPLSKSQIALSVMHHPVFGIIFLPHSVNLVHHLSPPSHHHFLSLPFQTVPQILPTTDPLLPTGLPTGLHRTAFTDFVPLSVVLVLSSSSFSWRVCRTKPAFISFFNNT